MPTTFSAIAFALRIALAGAITLAILHNFSWPNILLSTTSFAGLAYWLGSHRVELKLKYEAMETDAAIPGPYDKQLWRYKPKVKDLALGLAVLSLTFFYMAYIAVLGDPPTKIVKLIHQIAGVPGVVAAWCLIGTFAFAKAIEIAIGSRVNK